MRDQRPNWGISIHALLAESDIDKIPNQCQIDQFLSTLSLRRATSKYGPVPVHERFLSTLSLRRATGGLWMSPGGFWAFLSTLSLRRATERNHLFSRWIRYFYPRSPCGERLAGRGHVAGRHQISIHALLAESDQRRSRKTGRPLLFLSTLSLRRATVRRSTMADFDKIFLSTLSLRRATFKGDHGHIKGDISIHALLAESDERNHLFSRWIRYFYPRSPCGERPTKAQDRYKDTVTISIHALLAESDSLRQLQSALRRNFYPRSPCGERLYR